MAWKMVLFFQFLLCVLLFSIVLLSMLFYLLFFLFYFFLCLLLDLLFFILLYLLSLGCFPSFSFFCEVSSAYLIHLSGKCRQLQLENSIFSGNGFLFVLSVSPINIHIGCKQEF